MGAAVQRRVLHGIVPRESEAGGHRQAAGDGGALPIAGCGPPCDPSSTSWIPQRDLISECAARRAEAVAAVASGSVGHGVWQETPSSCDASGIPKKREEAPCCIEWTSGKNRWGFP